MKVKKGKVATYVNVNLSDLIRAMNKTFNTCIGPYGYGDDEHIFVNLKPAKEMPLNKKKSVSMKVALQDKDLIEKLFECYEQRDTVARLDIEFLLEIALAAQMIEGKNFIVHIDYKSNRY